MPGGQAGEMHRADLALVSAPGGGPWADARVSFDPVGTGRARAWWDLGATVPVRLVARMLELDGATKRFDTVAALDGCTFTARPGRLTGFVGPNGAGKTTAMRAVFGLVELDSGSVRWQGTPIGPESRARFGYMPEERGLYPRMRVRDQLIYLGRLCGRTSAEVGRSVDGWLERLDLASRAHDRLDRLSHGNQQRVQLVAALVNEPELLVLDEPFAGLDPLAMETMSDLLAEVASTGATVLFSSHQLDLVEDICQDVVIIDAGRVVRAGRLVDLRAEAPQRFVRVRYRGGRPPDWSGLPSVRVAEEGDGEVLLRVDQDVDLAALVTAVRRSSDVVSFAYQPPTLSELFRWAVAA